MATDEPGGRNGLERVQAWLDEAVTAGVFPCCAMAWGHRDHPLCFCFAGGANEDMLFDLASVSKPVGPGMLTLLALEKGELKLGDTLGMFFPAPEDKAGITLEQLLTHTAGFVPAFPLYETDAPPYRAAETILSYPLASAPGGAPVYSCMGFIVLGKLLETLYAQPLHALVTERVFKPLNMRRTAYCPLKEGFTVFAPTETDPDSGEALYGVVHDENARFLQGVSGNAGIFSAIGDMARFAAMLACEGGGFMLKDTLQMAVANRTQGYEDSRGLAFHLASPGSFFGDRFPEASFGHTGFTGTSFAVDGTTGFYVVLLTNRVHPTRRNEAILPFRRTFHNRMYQAFALSGVSSV